ncbi:MAG TPA: transporter [Burkholderiales bacterium]|nr:transporter [Burkholderiales bacterium]
MLLAALLAPGAYAQELEPRAYSNLPVGMNFLLVGFAKSEGSLSTAPALQIEDAELDIDTGLLAYARALNLWGNSGKVDVILPYSHLEGSALVSGVPRERDVSGYGDPRVRLSMNFYGAPALTMAEYPAYEHDLVIGASVQVAIPMGQYSSDRLINIGSNRWGIKTDVGFSKAFDKVTADFTVGATIFTDNDDFFGGQRLEQRPVYSTQVNLSYDFGENVWAALGYTYYFGGRTTVEGDTKDDELGNSRVGFTLSLPIDRNYSFKFNASKGVVTRFGTGFDVVGFLIQYRWGGGLSSGN